MTPQEQLEKAARRLEEANRFRLTAEGDLIRAKTAVNEARRAYSAAHEAVSPAPMVEVIVPEGFEHVGWVCQHGEVIGGSYIRTPHRQPDHGKTKRGWTENNNVVRGFDSTLKVTVEEAEKRCQYRVPAFIKKDEQ